MTAILDNQVEPEIGPAPLYRLPEKTGWKLVAWAAIWCIAAFAATFLVGFFVGVVSSVTGLKKVLASNDLAALYSSVGSFGAFAVLIGVSRSQGRAPRDAAPAGASASITRPVLTGLISVLLALYSAAIAFGIYHAAPAILHAMVGQSWWMVGLVALIVVVGAPVAEELFFRGWLWDGLRQSWGPFATGLITSVLWLLVHLPDGVARITLLLPLAIALPVIRQKASSIYAPMVVHACYNAAGVAIACLVLWRGWPS